MLRVTPLYGSSTNPQSNGTESQDLPSSTLIEYAGTKVLVNVGWNVDTDHKAAVAKADPDCVVITDSTIQSIGGLPSWWWNRKQVESPPQTGDEGNTKDPSNPSSKTIQTSDPDATEKDPMVKDEDDDPTSTAEVPIYATFPAIKMGQMTLYDQHAALCLDGKNPPFSLEAIDDCVSAITPIKYSQHITQGQLRITAYAAGNTVGAAFFVLQRPHDDTFVVVTPHKYNIAQELILRRSPLLQTAASPDVWVTHPGYQPPLLRPPPTLSSSRSSSSMDRLTESVLTILRGDGHVLLPTDASGRCLELLLHLHRHWESQRLQSTYHLIWLAPMAHNVYEFAKSQLEWMRLPLETMNNNNMTHPLELSNVRRCTSMAELDAAVEKNNNPCCVVASGLSLDGACGVLLCISFRALLVFWFQRFVFVAIHAYAIDWTSHCLMLHQIQLDLPVMSCSATRTIQKTLSSLLIHPNAIYAPHSVSSPLPV